MFEESVSLVVSSWVSVWYGGRSVVFGVLSSRFRVDLSFVSFVLDVDFCLLCCCVVLNGDFLENSRIRRYRVCETRLPQPTPVQIEKKSILCRNAIDIAQ